MLGESTLPMAAEQLNVEIRVDVLTLMSADTIEDAARAIYRTYDYGSGDEKRGVTLTILMDSVGSTYAMTPGNWCIYVGGYDESFTDGSLRDVVTAAVEPYMADRAWNGDDLTMSATALTQATEAMLYSVTDYVFGTETIPDIPVDTELPEDISMDYVLDLAGLLTYDQWKTLETRAVEISAQYGCGVYAVTVEDYADYGSSIESVIQDAYHQLELGEGSGNDGVILMLSMADRDFATFVYGDQTEYAFDDYGLKQMEGSFLDNFADNDWYGGFSDYLEECGAYLALQRQRRVARGGRGALPQRIRPAAAALRPLGGISGRTGRGGHRRSRRRHGGDLVLDAECGGRRVYRASYGGELRDPAAGLQQLRRRHRS